MCQIITQIVVKVKGHFMSDNLFYVSLCRDKEKQAATQPQHVCSVSVSIITVQGMRFAVIGRVPGGVAAWVGRQRSQWWVNCECSRHITLGTKENAVQGIVGVFW